MNSMMDKTNNEIMINSIRKYSGYQFIEMLVVAVIAAFQVHLIKKLFQNDSILWESAKLIICAFNQS